MKLILLVILMTGSIAIAQGGHTGHGQPAPKVKPTSRPAEKVKEIAPEKLAEKKDEPRVSIDVPSEQQAKIGLKTAKSSAQPLVQKIRTIGSISADQTREAHVHTRINGWIEKIFADAVGKSVKKGEPLFDLYSPDLVSTQEEYLAGRSRGETGREIADAAIERLRRWAVPEAEIKSLKSGGKVKRALTFRSPVDGFIVNKTAINGMYVTPEMELYYIAELSKIWVMVTLYESDIAMIRVGDKAEIHQPYGDQQIISAPISYIYPEIDIETRTSKARIELANPELRLKPGMYVNVEIRKDLGSAISIAEDSVIDTGLRKLVFVRKGATRFEPREVKIGPRVENRFVVLSGLEAGEEVVVAAQFLIDAESKIQAALGRGNSPEKAGKK